MNRRKFPAISILLALHLIFFSCHLAEKPVTKEQALNLANEIESSVKHHQTAKLNGIFEMEVLTERISAVSSQKPNKAMMQGVKKGLGEFRFGDEIVKATGDKGTYALVKQYEKDNKRHLLFRLYADSRINYHDYELINIGESIKAADIYIYLTGEELSKTLAETMVMMNNEYKKMSPKEFEKFQTITKMKKLILENDYEKAREYYDQLPANLKKQKLFQLIHVQIASGLGDDYYNRAMEEFLSLYPKEPNMQMMMIDRYLLNQDYDKAINCVNELDSMINKDPFLDFYRGVIYRMSSSLDKAQQCLERLNKNMPNFGEGTVELIANYASQNQIQKALDLVKKYKQSEEFDPVLLQGLYNLYPDLED